MAYTRQEISKRQYLRKKDSNVCVQCGGEKDREGLYCNWCKTRFNMYCRDRRTMLREMGICPYCRKEKLETGEKKCKSCKEKARLYALEYRRKKIG